MSALTRRTLLTAGAAVAVAGAAALPRPGKAAAPARAAQDAGVYRSKLGAYQLTALYDDTWYLPIDDTFMRNASGAQVNAALAAALS